MKKTLLLVFSLFAVACSNDTDDSAERQLANTEPTGAFTSEGTLAPNDRSAFKAGCETPGEPAPNIGYDLRLRVGMAFSLGTVFKNYKGTNVRVKGEQTILKVSKKLLRVEYIATTAEGIDGIIPGVKRERTCRLKNTKDGWVEDCNDPTLRMLSTLGTVSPQTDLTNCTIENVTQENSSFSNEIGFYQFENGNRVRAYRNSFTANGTVICGNENKGSGKMNFVQIRTNHIPSTTYSFCGGVDIFISYSTTTSAGEVLSEGKMETFVGPLVNNN